MRTPAILIIVCFLTLSAKHSGPQEPPAKVAPVVNFCEAARNPDTYNGKVISIRARVSHEFEDFTLFDDACWEQPDIWIELGGDQQCTYDWESAGFSCKHGQNIKFRGVEYPIVKDESLETFLKLLGARKGKKSAYRVTATLTGTFFGQEPKQYSKPAINFVGYGYGHLGCCFQLIVTQVSEVTSSNKVEDRAGEWRKRFSRKGDKQH